MPHIETDDGISVFYTTDGSSSNPPLVLSNSLGTNTGMWAGQMDQLADRFHVIRYDMRGHGRSDAPEEHYTIDRLGRDVLNLLDGLGIRRAAWCGVSMGGMLGMWLGVHAPERVSRLAVCNTALHMPPADLWNDRIRTVLDKGMEALVGPVLERWFTPAFRANRPEEVEPVKQMLLATPSAGYAGCCAALRDMDQRDAVGAIRHPVLIIAGRDDPSTPPERAEEIKERITHAELVVFDDCAHLSNIERKDAFNRVVVPFLVEAV